jgi:transcriptional regulator with PAS, ATPase and Fis domain
MDTIRSIAARRCCITITGETGTGKEMVARQIHLHSDRKDRCFVPVDCTTLTGQLFESQLFGHTKGAFTGAVDNTLGFFRAADGGTIFLDEISEIPLELQAKLLRVLQEGTVTPLGSTQSYRIDVRVVCATNRDLRKMVDKNEFRADLYYRLNVVNLQIPPLRQRPEDILLLADYFLANLSEFYGEPAKELSPEARQILLRYPWPGNVREMSNAMERAYVLSKGTVIRPEALPPEILLTDPVKNPGSPLPTLQEAEERLVREALKVARGRKIEAARLLGVERRRLNRILDRLNIHAAQFRTD